MLTDTNCNLASLDAYVPSPENPWNVSRVHHLYRRIGFGASKEEVIAALSQSPTALVDSLIDQAVAMLPTTEPLWWNWNGDQFEAAETANEDNTPGFYRNQWKNQMIGDLIQNKVRDRMTLFWSNHFVTEDDVYRSPAYQFQYYNLLQMNALGNFRDFVYAIGTSNAMLVYLNGDENIKDRPNENYARELYELFTLGVDNGYTENDIQETAKALTGFVETLNDIAWGDIIFVLAQYSNETKTIFGQTGNWGYDNVIDILFEQRGTLVANFICAKLYTYFVSPSCNDAIVAEMAQTFITNNYEIAPVLRQLFKSQHFFDQNAIGSIIKSPLDILICFYNELGFPLSNIDVNDFILDSSRMLGQEVLNPIDVEGWQGDEDWISPDLLIGRWDFARFIINRGWEENQQQFRDFLIGLPIGTAGDGNLQSTLSGADVDIVVRAIVNYFFPRGMADDVIYNEIAGVFKDIDAFPPSYYEPGAAEPNIWRFDRPEVSEQFLKLLDFIADIPEFQLK